MLIEVYEGVIVMNNNFEQDLADGQLGEKAVRHFVETQWNKKFILETLRHLT